MTVIWRNKSPLVDLPDISFLFALAGSVILWSSSPLSFIYFLLLPCMMTIILPHIQAEFIRLFQVLQISCLPRGNISSSQALILPHSLQSTTYLLFFLTAVILPHSLYSSSQPLFFLTTKLISSNAQEVHTLVLISRLLHDLGLFFHISGILP